MRTERLLHHEGKTIAWRFLRAAPGPGLAPHIAGYTDYDEVAAGPVRRRELPETGVVMIINLGAPLSVADPRDYAARDPEGHLWCFGTYRPEAGAGE